MLRQFYSHAVCVDELAYGITSCAPVASLMHIDRGLQEQVADAAEALCGPPAADDQIPLRRVQW
jgi:hypothetical protein